MKHELVPFLSQFAHAAIQMQSYAMNLFSAWFSCDGLFCVSSLPFSTQDPGYQDRLPRMIF